MPRRREAWLLAALAPAATLALDPGGWFPFGPVKWLLIPTLVLGGAALVLADRPVRAPRAVRLALGALLAWLALAAAVGEDGWYAWVGTPERRFGVLTWALCGVALVAGAALDPARHGRPIVTGLLAAGCGVGGVATAEAVGFEPDVLDVGSRLAGTVGSSAYLGAAVALLLPVALGVAADGGASRRRRAVAGVAAGLLAVAGVGSGARAAWSGLAVAGLAAAVARRRDLAATVRRSPGRAAAVVGAGLVAGLVVLVATPAGARLGALGDADAAGGRGRLDEWRVAVRVLGDDPVFGVGPEGYRLAFPGAVDEAYVRDHGRDEVTDRAHSGPLDVALAGGLPALVAWGAVVVAVARACGTLLREGAAWQTGLAAGLVAHGAGQLAFFPVVELEPVAWLLAGLVLAAAAPAGQAGPDEGAEPVGARGVATGPGRRALVGLCAVGAVVTAVTGVLEVVADRRAREAVDELAAGDGGGALAAADAAADLRPDVLRLHLLAGRAAVAAERGAQAGLQRVDDALAVSGGDPAALLERARLLVARAEATGTEAHREAARRELDRRLAADPHHPALWALAARLADLDGDRAGATAAWDRVAALTPPHRR